VTTQRGKFQFSNPTAQAAEARLNAQEARKLVERHTPKHLREQEPEVTTAAGACFRRVSSILAGRGK